MAGVTSDQIKTGYQDESVAASYDRDRFTSIVGRTFDALEKRAIRALLQKHAAAGAGSTVLDVPCGTGRITELLATVGGRVTGADVSDAMIRVARPKCARFGPRVSFQLLDLDALAVPDASFDLVTCVRLFHHLDSPARARILRELGRVSRRWVLVNVSLSTPLYRFRRRLKRLAGQGISAASSTWTEIHGELSGSGLELRDHACVLRFGSEDVVLLLEKTSR